MQHTNERRVRKWEKKVRRDVIKDESSKWRGEQQQRVMEDCSTEKRLRKNVLLPTVERQVHRTSRDVDEAERSRHLASVSAEPM